MNRLENDSSRGDSLATEDIENSLKSLWEKVRITTESIVQLRNEKQLLENERVGLEKEIMRLKHDILTNEQDIKRLKTEQLQMMNSKSSEVFTAQETEALKGRIRELIAKLNSHL